MRFAALRTMLLAAAALSSAGAGAGAADGMPDFGLDRVRLKDLPSYRCDDGPRIPEPVDTGFYDDLGPGPVRVESLIKVSVNGGASRAEISFPSLGAAAGVIGYRSRLFIKLLPGTEGPVLSWAAVLCSGGSYVGYKGSSLLLSASEERLLIRDDALAMGWQRDRLRSTHPWLAGEGSLDGLCAWHPGVLRRYFPESLPSEKEGRRFRYDVGAHRLVVTWSK
ncbi:MAG: hypothetical protein M0011_01900 [Elusimicrobia bacterium]|nr:hypothetical protein [Elusimicrobiota bacterium]